MDTLEACQYLQRSIGAGSSSTTKLIALLSGLVSVPDVVTGPEEAPQKVLATAVSERDCVRTAFPVEISKEALVSLFDVSGIAMDIHVSLFHDDWIDRVVRMGLGDNRLAARVLHLGKIGPMASRCPSYSININISLQFLDSLQMECCHASVKREQARSIGLQPLVHWKIRKSKPGRTDELVMGSLLERQIPRMVSLMKKVTRRVLQVSRGMDRAAFRHTPRILAHIHKRLLAMEGDSEEYTTGSVQIKQLRSKLEMFYAAGPAAIFHDASRTRSDPVTVVHPRHPITLTKTIASASSSRGDQLMSLTATPSGSRHQVLSVAHQGAEASSPGGTAESAKTRKTRLTILNFKLRHLLQAVLLAIVTEVVGLMRLMQDRTGISWWPFAAWVFDLVLARVQPGHSYHPSFWLEGALDDLPPSDPRAAERGRFTRGGRSGHGTPDSILKPAAAVDTAASAPAELGNTPSRRLPSLMAAKAVAPMNLRRVSWSTASSSDSEGDLDPKRPLAAEIKSRKRLPKSPKPKPHSPLMSNSPSSRPIIEPIQLIITKSPAQISPPRVTREHPSSSLDQNAPDKEN